jgi:aminoglycoside phosphotransferase (APT) family kinase protein
LIRISSPEDEPAIAAFVASALGCLATVVERLEAFATNAAFAVETDGRRFVVKASRLDDALRAEAWACARARAAGCPAPVISASGRLDDGRSAFVMGRVTGSPIVGRHPALREVGAALRRLHEVRLPGFGWLAEASWDDRAGCSLRHRSWLGFLEGICDDVRRLADHYSVAAPVAREAAAVIDDHADALAAPSVGSLCHGDLKPGHILVEADRLAGVIDWGDAAVADPVWDIARFAHRADPAMLSLLLEGYDPEPRVFDELGWRLPLYGALWTLVDAVVDHRVGHRADPGLEAAMRILS